jgi:predicted Zn-dependent protease
MPTPFIAGHILGTTIATNAILKKSRHNESAADTNAIRAIIKLGWSCQGVASLYEKIGQNCGGIYFAYMSTHPPCSDRVAKAKKACREHRPTEEGQQTVAALQKRFATMQIKIKALFWPINIAQKQFANPKDRNQQYGAAIVAWRQHKYEQSVKIITGLLATTPERSARYMTEVLAVGLIHMNKGEEAARICWNKLAKTPLRDLGMIFADAVIENKLKHYYPHAVRILQLIIIKHPYYVWALDALGKIYALSGDTPRAELYAAKFAYEIGDIEAAKIHNTKALSSSDKSVTRQAKDLQEKNKEPT